jgi:hypothetical protein
MSVKSLVAIAGLNALLLLDAAPRTPLLAQTAPQSATSTTPPVRRAPTRIEINPRPLLYRRCVDWYELQNRPSGTVLYPQMRCWWVRG